MRDVAFVVALASTFAWLVTAQVFILAGLLRRRRHWRALSALLLPLLAPYWAFRGGMRVRGTLWAAGAALYALAHLATHWYG